MSDRTYPRKWFRVSNYGGGIEEREFIRETEKMLIAKRLRGSSVSERREAKADSYGRWYPEREEADAIIAARRGREAEQVSAQRIRDAAPDLLVALQGYLTDCTNDECERCICARAALARATGAA